MPTSVQIGLLVLGGVLVLIAILGGNFKLFGAEVADKISNRFLRFVAFVFGTVLIIAALQSPPPNEESRIPTQNSKTLQVYADSTKGTPWLNKENGYVNVSFEATGEWLAIPEDYSGPGVPNDAKGYLPPTGALNFKPNKTVCAGAPLGALAVIGEDKQCKASGAQGRFELKPGETVYFMMNDVPSLYQDNKGQITVKLSTSKG